MKNVLYVSPYSPISSVQGAGGQACNYYVKKLSKMSDISLLVLCASHDRDKEFVELKSEGLDGIIFQIPKKNIFSRIISKFYINYSGYLDFRYVKSMIKNAMRIKTEFSFTPDFVIFDWEETAYLLPDLKKIFPNSKFSVVEQDVVSQLRFRYYKNEKNLFGRLYKFLLYKNILRLEKKMFGNIDMVQVFTKKDADLVKNVSSSVNIFVMSPYYHNFNIFPLVKNRKNDILFYGYLARAENQEAAFWLIEKILPNLPKECRCVILGGNPPESLIKMQNERVVITGFQSEEQLVEWFKNSLCMVVPLKHGAGIKIKVLEAMSSGLPVLTNEIGIEGIPAKNGVDYIHCESENDFVQGIKTLLQNKDYAYNIGNSSRELLQREFNYEDSSYLCWSV